MAVVGAGAVGCYFGGMLARAGVPVTLIGRRAHMEAVARDGLLLEGLRVHERIPLRTSTEISTARECDLVLLCVKTVDTESAAAALQPYLRAESLVVSLQNGVDNVDRIRTATGIAAVPGVVYVAAAMAGPGHVKHSGRGDLILGGRAGCAPDEKIAALARMFENAEVPCRVSGRVQEDLWAKMIMNCAFNAISALGRSRYLPMVRFQPVRDLMQMVITEAVSVAQAEGAQLSETEMTEAAYQLGEAMAGALSSTAQDLNRGKPTEIDSLNGYVVCKGEALGIPVPVNRTLYALVKLLEQTQSSQAPGM
ncbi:MAG: 2-dehydropantoate 2-reductase [Bryobacteraceae bacterium]